MRRSLLLFAVVFAIPLSSACALDELRGVGAVWSDFVGALRRGDYMNAHGLFSAQSRRAMPYGEFVEEYGPLSAARELILAKPDSLSTRVDGDWGEIAYGGVNPGTGRKFSVGVSFVRNRNAWGLVAARNESLERVEAGARALLRLLWENREHGAPRDLVAALVKAQSANPVFQYYRLETDGARFTAFPREEVLRTFFVDEWGAIRSPEEAPRQPSTLQTTPQASALAPSPAPAAPRPYPSVMPELSEPGAAAPAPRAPASLDDWAESPMPGAAPRVPAERPNVMLPDTIR